MTAKRNGAVVALVGAVIVALGTVAAAVITTYGDGTETGGTPQPSVTTSPPVGTASAEPSVTRVPLTPGHALADLEPIEGEALIETVPQTMNGVERTRPIALELGCFEEPRAVTYHLGRQYSRFEAVVGQSDSSTEKDPVLFEVVVDEVTLFSSELGFGEEASVGVDLGSAPQQGFRLTIQVDGHTDCNEKQVAVWSDARVVP
ncbi:MAG: NPCBM/NEW2 domain-containing protein [Pseudonocardiaceae bacterium]